MILAKLRMRTARRRHPPRGAGMMRMPPVVVGMGGMTTITWSRPTPLPRPWFFSELITSETIREAARRYAAAVDGSEKRYDYRHGHFSIKAAREHLLQAAFDAWVAACGAKPEADGEQVANVHYQSAWMAAARRVVSKRWRSPRAVRSAWRSFGPVITAMLASAGRKDAVRDYLAVHVLPYFDGTAVQKTGEEPDSDEIGIILKCRAAGGKKLVDAWRDVLKDLIASL